MVNRAKSILVCIVVVSVIITSLVTVVPKADSIDFMYGDVNNDQQITAGDALLILQYSVKKIDFSDRQLAVAMVGNKGVVTASDALLVLQAAVDKITPENFPSGRNGMYNPEESSSQTASSEPESSAPESSSSAPQSSEPASSDPGPSSQASSVTESSTPSVPLILTPVAQTDYWSYNQLTSVQKQYYNKIVQGVKARTTSYIFMGNGSTVQQADVRFAYFAVQRDHPELFYMPLSYVMIRQGSASYIALCYKDVDYYLYSAQAVAAITPLLEAKIQEIYDEVLAGGMSDYEMAVALHDWTVDNTSYYYEALDDPASYPEAWSAANVLVGNHKGVCEGFSRAYQLLLYNCGINSMLISGQGGGEAHMWNLVKLDGKWYETDITWADQNIDGKSFYFYFNQTTEIMGYSHARDINISNLAPEDFLTARAFNYNPPVCTATENNYFAKNNTVFADAAEFAERAPALIAANAAAGKRFLDVMIAGEVFYTTNDAMNYITREIILSANRLINPPHKDISLWGPMVIPGACGFTVEWEY